MPEYIDMTPKWAALMPAMLLVLEQGETEKAKQSIRDELKRMASALDESNERAKRAEEQLPPPDLLSNVRFCQINDIPMVLPPDCGYYLGCVDGREGKRKWYCCEAFINNTPDIDSLQPMESHTMWNAVIEKLPDVKEWAFMALEMFKDTWKKGI